MHLEMYRFFYYLCNSATLSKSFIIDIFWELVTPAICFKAIHLFGSLFLWANVKFDVSKTNN